jgi:ribosomal-protein-alanine N-acetyltransferase
MALYDFSFFPTLLTPRLRLRELNPSDANDIFQFRSDPEVLRYMNEPQQRNVSEALTLIEDIRQWFAEKKAITWGITLRGEDRVCGMIGFYFWGKEYYKTELGYDLARQYWGQGIAIEAMRAVVKFGFEEMKLHRVNVDTRMDNLPSVRLVQRAGFTHEGVRRECIRNPDGTYQSWGMFGLLEQEYSSRN